MHIQPIVGWSLWMAGCTKCPSVVLRKDAAFRACRHNLQLADTFDVEVASTTFYLEGDVAFWVCYTFRY